VRTVRWLAWTVGILFLLGTALQLVDQLNLYATPPEPSGTLNMVEFRLFVQPYRVAIWPIFFLNNLSFGIAFVALAGLGVALASWLASGDQRRIAIATSLAVGGVLGAVGQLILIGATQVTIDTAYCDCGFKETEIVAQIWGQMLVEGASNWLLNGALVLAGIGVLAVDAAFRRRMPAAWDVLSWLTAIVSIATVVVFFLQVGEDLGRYLLLFLSGILVPIWTIWLGFSLRGGPDAVSAAATAAAGSGADDRPG
jgi:hypothetical protein